MKIIILFAILNTLLFSNPIDIKSFEADFVQKITDDKGKTLTYSGHVVAKKPQYALWIYKKPVEKQIYINTYSITIVEPELEQVVIKDIEDEFNFFDMIKNAKQIDKTHYKTNFKETTFDITIKNGKISSISYFDNFENKVKIFFSNQKQNTNPKDELFKAKFPLEYDIVED